MGRNPIIHNIFHVPDHVAPEEILSIAEGLRRLVDLGREGIVVYDDDETIVFANRLVGQWIETSPEALIGRRLHEFFHDENLGIIRDLRDLARRGADPLLPTIEMDQGGSRRMDVEVDVICIGDADRPLSYLHLRDRTERIRTEGALRNANLFFKKVLDSAGDGIIAVDMRGKIILFNRGAERLLGYTRAEALRDLHVRRLYPKGGAARIMAMLRGPDHGGPGRCERQRILGLHKDGREIPVALSGSLIVDEDGREIATVGIFTDLREIEAMDRELRTQQDALAAVEKLSSLGKLAAGVAHEINNPLTGILAYVEGLLDESAPDDPRRPDYEVIHRETIRCREIVKNLLDFGRQQEPRPVLNDVNPIVRRALQLVDRLPRFRNATLRTELAPDLPPVVCDATQVQQVVINLLVNAAEAMPHGGAITVGSRRIAQPPAVELFVADTGVGMSDEVRSHIFEPFYSTKGGKTNGLGLAVSWGIVERHGGTIRVASEPGAGTTFRVLLPLSAAPAAPPNEDDPR
jgi:PAS domain S-box-containing protein